MVKKTFPLCLGLIFFAQRHLNVLCRYSKTLKKDELSISVKQYYLYIHTLNINKKMLIKSYRIAYPSYPHVYLRGVSGLYFSVGDLSTKSRSSSEPKALCCCLFQSTSMNLRGILQPVEQVKPSGPFWVFIFLTKQEGSI